MWEACAQGKLGTERTPPLSQKATGQGIDVWSLRRSLRALLAALPLCAGTMTGRADIEVLVDRPINRMRQMFMRRSLFEQEAGTGIQERFSISISDVK